MPSPRAAAIERIARHLVDELEYQCAAPDGQRHVTFESTDRLFARDVVARVRQILAGETLPRHEDPDD